jgi:hypothetical protein
LSGAFSHFEEKPHPATRGHKCPLASTLPEDGEGFREAA